MENNVVGVYDSYSQAQSAMNELLASGFSRNSIQLNPDQETRTAGTLTSADTSHESGIGHFFRSLFGMDEGSKQGDIYSEAVRRGSVVLIVTASAEEDRDRAMEVMNRYDPVDIDDRATHWTSQGWTGYDASAPTYTDAEIQQDRSRYAQGSTANLQATGATSTEAKIPIVQEELKVGKREVQRGGVRVYQRVRETPVEETVQLREERVVVERRPVDQPATEADLAAFKEGTVELRETAEEAVVEKTARVVEEVVVGKEVTQQTARIEDTVRSTEVEVEQMAGADDSDFRHHWQTAYGQSGDRYEDYDAAYRYGSTISATDRFKNYRWDDVEPDVRRDWESSHPESTWDKVKDAVRYGVERVKGAARH